jgi:hypothetical protein
MINNVHFSQYISPLNFHIVTGTWTQVAGQVAGTICLHKAAAAETSVVTVPVEAPSNSIALQGSKLLSVEIDFEVLVADLTSITATIKKISRGIEGAVAVATAVTFTQSPTAALAKAVEQHKLVLTLDTPAWIDNDEYYLVQLSCVAPATTTLDFLAAVANFVFRA